MSALGNIRRSSTKDTWGTPEMIMNLLRSEWSFTLDVCASEDNAKAERWLEGPHWDLWADEGRCVCGLCSSWVGEVCFMNPPYSTCIDWVRKAAATVQIANAPTTVVGLLPHFVDNPWWEIVLRSCRNYYPIRERIPFIHPIDCDCKSCLNGTHSSNTFSSVIVEWKTTPWHTMAHIPGTGLISWRRANG